MFNAGGNKQNGTIYEQLQGSKEAFYILDKDGSGSIDSKQMNVAMCAFGFVAHTKLEIQSIISDVDGDGSCTIEYETSYGNCGPRYNVVPDNAQSVANTRQLLFYNIDLESNIDIVLVPRMCFYNIDLNSNVDIVLLHRRDYVTEHVTYNIVPGSTQSVANTHNMLFYSMDLTSNVDIVLIHRICVVYNMDLNSNIGIVRIRRNDSVADKVADNIVPGNAQSVANTHNMFFYNMDLNSTIV